MDLMKTMRLIHRSFEYTINSSVVRHVAANIIMQPRRGDGNRAEALSGKGFVAIRSGSGLMFAGYRGAKLTKNLHFI
jgi:hypothetical protein